MNLEDLGIPFPEEDIEWRVAEAGKSPKGIWAKVLAYVTNRAIMDRLDAVCGSENWKNEFVTGPQGGVLCGLSIRVNNEWITKWDGCENSEIEPVKGGLSGAMKRAAVHWKIGRYLYGLDIGWANVCKDGKHYGRLPKDKGGDAFYWEAPVLPPWALPKGYKPKPAPKKEQPVDREEPQAVAKPEPPVTGPVPLTTADLDKKFLSAMGAIRTAKSDDYIDKVMERVAVVPFTQVHLLAIDAAQQDRRKALKG